MTGKQSGQIRDLSEFIGSELRYPQVIRLCRDFGLLIKEINTSAIPTKTHGRGGVANLRASAYLAARHAKTTFCLVEEETEQSITPALSSMAALEEFVSQNMIDILHEYLFNSETNQPFSLCATSDIKRV